MPREKQIEFPKEQLPHPLVAPVTWALAIACIVAVIIILTATEWNSFFGPW
jgi:hypothetical protein